MKGTASQTVQNQIKSGELVVSAVATHKEDVSEQLFKLQKSAPADRLTQAEIKRWLEWLGSELNASGNDLWDAELAYTSEQGEGAVAMDERDALGADLDEALRMTRNGAERVCGASKLSIYGLVSPPPTDFNGRRKYAENAVKSLRKNPAVTTRFGQTFDPGASADSLDTLLSGYTQALETDSREKRELEDAKGRRDRRMDEWKTGYTHIAAQVEALFRQAKRPYLADRVRPTERRVRGDEAPPAEDAAVVADPNVAQPEPVTPAPVADEPSL